MKKSELKQLIREEIKRLNENSPIFEKDTFVKFDYHGIPETDISLNQ